MRLLLNIKKRKRGADKKYDPKNEFFSYSAYLNEKKRLMSFYNNGFSTKWLKRYSQQSHKYIGQPLGNILFLVERRLDVALYRIKFCSSVSQARQIIGHGKVLVNDVSVLRPSYQLKPGDVLRIKKLNGLDLSDQNFTLLETPKRRKIHSLDPMTHKRRKQQIFRNKIKQSQNLIKKPLFLFRFLHFEVNYILKTAIFLYSPQVLYYPDKIRLDFIRRRFRV